MPLELGRDEYCLPRVSQVHDHSKLSLFRVMMVTHSLSKILESFSWYGHAVVGLELC